MKICGFTNPWASAGLVAAVTVCAAPAVAQTPVGTAFTYQGQLALDGEPVSGDVDLLFTLWDASAAGAAVAPPQQIDALAVEEGRFTVVLDFGAQFHGEARFLEIAVRSPAGVGAFTTLAPRQELTPAPYALGLSLPFQGIANLNAGGAFEIINNDMGWAGVFRNNNPANPDAALNVTSMGGPAGQFFNGTGGLALVARAIGNGTAVHAEAPGLGNQAKAIHGRITVPNGGSESAAVRGETVSSATNASGVWGSNVGMGWGVRGQSLNDVAGIGVLGSSIGRAGIGVHGLADGGGAPGGGEPGGGSGPNPDGNQGLSYGVLGQSMSVMGVGVRGESNTGVEGEGQRYGVYGIATELSGEGVRGEGTHGVWGLGNDGGAGVVGEAGNSATMGVWAIGGLGGRLGAPALRADGGTGPAIYALGGRAITGEGTEFGVYGLSLGANGVGGTFGNLEGGLALRATGDAEVQGTLTVNVLEILGGADLAERFEFSEGAEPGMVVAIDPAQPGKLQVSREAYNRRVAGVISGANELAAGVVLGTAPADDRNLPVAMSGRVWVKCDTRAGGVEPGDLLTTSDLAGHAMPVADGADADGAIIGKAMTSLAQGEAGMVLVLVNLQ